MNNYGALMMSVTMTMTAVMLPRICLAWMAAQRCDEVETELLELVLAEQNRWIWRHLGCGAVAVALIWLTQSSRYDLAIPASMELALACYATVSLVFAVLESLVAQKVATFIALAPVPVRKGED